MKKDDVKIIAYYLPQFHETKENNEFWGEGYTEWTNVKKAKPIYKGHNQPRIPINNDYYDLLDGTKIISHMNLARKYGIYGFCFYHYWFGNHRQILNKPVDALLNLDITLPFCFCWAKFYIFWALCLRSPCWLDSFTGMRGRIFFLFA